MDSLKDRWKSLPSSVRKPLVFVVGVLIVIGGIILLPLPGPGWVIIFAGFALLATEFAVAEKVRDWLVNVFKTALRYLKLAWASIRGKSVYEAPQDDHAETASPANPAKKPVKAKTKH